MGAAWTALVAIGEAESFDDIKENMPAEKVIHANNDNHEIYLKIFEKYERMVSDLMVYFT